MDINKYEFYIKKTKYLKFIIKYLKFIIKTKNIKINFLKIKIIKN